MSLPLPDRRSDHRLNGVPAGQISVKDWNALDEEGREELIEQAVAAQINQEEWKRQTEVVVNAYYREVEQLRADLKITQQQVKDLSRLYNALKHRDGE